MEQREGLVFICNFWWLNFIYTVILRIHNIVWIIIHFRPSVTEFGDGFESNEVSFVSICFSLFLLNLSQDMEMADKT